ncbi:MmgE/PrpD family protein [Salirhabdus salicampi]|uniref:MmgE/PrpD family protein n=1 Tax=Salirhabdus salicampi TaxID=476102 RepID=UPI0020C30667|nr:MmgE/PrpD family protein [Salirhabdus salicampi]MCP8616310.1 MmgE/PrpD family protein [Salirhabdus salicampi]
MENTVIQRKSIELANYVSNLKFEDIPDHVVDEVQTLIFDYLGVTLRGSTTDSGRIAQEFQEEYGSVKPEATLIGSGKKITSQAAAFANAVSSHSIEMDDVDDLALFHFSPPIISAALAVAEANHSSGKELITAITVGCDIMKRLSDAMNPNLRDRGYHTTPVCGVFGATAAAARLEGLSSDEIVSAFGLAGAHASGLMEMYGSNMQKRINPGPAAQNGIVAARLAKRGYTGADTIFDGKRGVLRVFANQEDGSALVDGLGEKFNLGIEYKRYACARPIHNAVDCALNIRPDVLNQLENIKEMKIFRHPSWAHYHEIKSPKSIHEAQVSLNHGVAVALVEGDAFLEHFTDKWISHPEVKRLSTMLEFVPDKELSRGVSCKLQVVLNNGNTYESQVDYPKGSIQNPMSKEEHRTKLALLAGEHLNRAQLIQIHEMIENLQSLETINELMDKIH